MYTDHFLDNISYRSTEFPILLREAQRNLRVFQLSNQLHISYINNSISKSTIVGESVIPEIRNKIGSPLRPVKTETCIIKSSLKGCSKFVKVSVSLSLAFLEAPSGKITFNCDPFTIASVWTSKEFYISSQALNVNAFRFDLKFESSNERNIGLK